MLGVTVETGIILEWLKNEGERVEKGEPLFVVEADKVTTEAESPASGILSKILLPVGEKVPVLTVIAVITEPGEELPSKYQVNVENKMVVKHAEVAHAYSKEAGAASPVTLSKNDQVRAVPAASGPLAGLCGSALRTARRGSRLLSAPHRDRRPRRLAPRPV